MKPEHIAHRLKHCALLAERSPCGRAQYGAIILQAGAVVSEGWNGPPRGSMTSYSPGGGCSRDRLRIKSGERSEIGCHHAEANAILNAAARGIACGGGVLICNGAPCLSCAKMIHHAGLRQVITSAGRSLDGVRYLLAHGVEVVLQ
jgi:dCMP deaminase